MGLYVFLYNDQITIDIESIEFQREAANQGMMDDSFVWIVTDGTTGEPSLLKEGKLLFVIFFKDYSLSPKQNIIEQII